MDLHGWPLACKRRGMAWSGSLFVTWCHGIWNNFIPTRKTIYVSMPRLRISRDVLEPADDQVEPETKRLGTKKTTTKKQSMHDKKRRAEPYHLSHFHHISENIICATVFFGGSDLRMEKPPFPMGRVILKPPFPMGRVGLLGLETIRDAISPTGLVQLNPV